MPVTQSGREYGLSFSPGVSTADSLTNSNMDALLAPQGSVSDLSIVAPAATAPGLSAVWWLIGLLALLVGLKFASEHEKSGMDPQVMGIGVYNWVAVGLTASTFIIVWKTIFNKYHVKGVTDLFNSI